MGEFNCLQCLQSQKVIDYTLNTYLNQFFYRLILLMQKNEKISIKLVPIINSNLPPSSGGKKKVQIKGILTNSPTSLE